MWASEEAIDTAADEPPQEGQEGVPQNLLPHAAPVPRLHVGRKQGVSAGSRGSWGGRRSLSYLLPSSGKTKGRTLHSVVLLLWRTSSAPQSYPQLDWQVSPQPSFRSTASRPQRPTSLPFSSPAGSLSLRRSCSLQSHTKFCHDAARLQQRFHENSASMATKFGLTSLGRGNRCGLAVLGIELVLIALIDKSPSALMTQAH